jgi:hypothetical protein
MKILIVEIQTNDWVRDFHLLHIKNETQSATSIMFVEEMEEFHPTIMKSFTREVNPLLPTANLNLKKSFLQYAFQSHFLNNISEFN